MSEEKSLNFIEEIVEADLASGKHKTILTRFPPEPNGYLHIGHAKSIFLNFGLAKKYGGATNLRFDDTNPVTEDTEYVDSIKDDVKWLLSNENPWAQELYASDYFEQIYQFAVDLIKKGLAYVDDSTSEEIATQKGTPTQPGVNNQYRERSVEENLQLFTAMREGKYNDGEKVLRAKIDMASTNMLLRDPIIYRIKHAHHHRTGDVWCIYPMYDFARLNMTYSVMSKRKLLQLVNEGHVSSWDDPRMPTISGMRRRGFTPESLREFCDKIGVAKRENLIDFSLLEFCVREHLNKIAQRRMVVFDPIKVVITNYELGEEILLSENNPEDENGGDRNIPFSKEIYIEKDDFMEVAPKKYFRLAPGQMVRLKSAYIIKCDEVIKDAEGNIVQLNCSYIPESKSGSDTSGIHVKGTLHWVSISKAVPIEVRLYDRLFTEENVAAAEGDFKGYINQDSLTVLPIAYGEPSLKEATIEERHQFIRKGYFCVDKESTPDKLIFNRTVTLKDTWAKVNR